LTVNLTDEDRKILEQVQRKFNEAEKRQKLHRRKWEDYYGLYRSYRDFRQYQDGLPRDTDRGLQDAQDRFGAELFIPVGFWTVETVLPRLLSQSPRMLLLPRDAQAQQNMLNMKMIVEAQQDQIDYELVLQDLAKDGLIYGLGVQKSFWRTETRQQRFLRQATVPSGQVQWVEDVKESVVFDDNDAEAVDPFDFFPDPLGYDMRTCGWVVHRLWMSTEKVLAKVESGQWDHTPLTPDDVRGMGAGAKYDDVWRARMRVSGFENPDLRGDQVHEVWEFHDRNEVITVLDRQVVVKVAPNPYWHGELPFQIFRPTRVNKQLVGIGEIEPLVDLQAEINTLRSQRRDNATFVLQRAYAYYEGMVDPADLKVGPGIAIPVDGDPRELLFPLPVGDIPASSYQEENSLMNNIDRTSGLSDVTIGAETGTGVTETATGAQLVHAAANVRIQNKTTLLEKETIRHAARQWLRNNQQKILTTRTVPMPSSKPGLRNAGRSPKWVLRSCRASGTSSPKAAPPHRTTCPSNARTPSSCFNCSAGPSRSTSSVCSSAPWACSGSRTPRRGLRRTRSRRRGLC
jgi:hypothetical protein